jgi:hypothetical protein
VAFFWVVLQEGIQEKGLIESMREGGIKSLVAFGMFSAFLVLLGSQVFRMQYVAEDLPAGIDPAAFRRAKSGYDILDPDRKWDDFYLNYNEGSGPFGMKKNAEIWNGRIAMVCLAASGYELSVLLTVKNSRSFRLRGCLARNLSRTKGL